jgi:hypothetical protein
MKKNPTKLLLIALSIAIIYIICIMLILINFVIEKTFGKKIDSNDIIEKFLYNYDSFEKVFDELSSEEYIIIKQDNGLISINIYSENNYIKIDKSEFYKYETTIDLMKNLNIKDITKKGDNVSFLFNSMINYGQYIVKIGDEESYHKNYIVTNIKAIKEQWYYVETK